MEADDARLRQWIGKSETRRDWIAPERAQALQATLDRMDPHLAAGDPLPPLWHWLYFWTVVPRSGLGRDGHPALGGFLPPVGTARRMWAGSRVAFPGRLTIGNHAERNSTIADVTVKTGRTGRLVFVTVRHEITGRDGLAVVDEQDIVYREDAGAGAARRAGEPAPGGATYTEEVRADPTMLFRYSALTFNGHRIHYGPTTSHHRSLRSVRYRRRQAGRHLNPERAGMAQPVRGRIGVSGDDRRCALRQQHPAGRQPSAAQR